jgi:hypothetical protein
MTYKDSFKNSKLDFSHTSSESLLINTNQPPANSAVKVPSETTINKAYQIFTGRLTKPN